MPTYNSYGSSSSKNTGLKGPHLGDHAGYIMDEDVETESQPFPSAALSSTTNTTTASSKYFEYPSTKPFINTNFTRAADKPVNAYPTTDRDAVVSALRNLQDKVKKLELERNAAEKNLQTLASDTEQYRDFLSTNRQDNLRPAKSPRGASNGSEGMVQSQTKELEGQLSSAESRCQLLEQQLDYMRKMVDTSERDRRELMQKTLLARQEKETASSGEDLKLHLNRLNELERDQLRLTATQTLAEMVEKEREKSKIKELEDRVKEEKRHRKTLQDRTAQLESATRDKKPSTYRVDSATQASVKPPSPAPPPPVIQTKKPPKKKKKKVATATTQTKRPSTCRSEPTRHYRLNLAEIPFVAGKSTTPSHSLGANVQKVLAMMKSHNLALCSNHANPRAAEQNHRSVSPTSSSAESTSSIDQDLNDVLIQLQDEFGQLSSEHQELVYQLHACRDKELREQLEQEMDSLVSRMEAKGQQISKVRQHQNKLEDGKKIKMAAKSNGKAKRPRSAGGQMNGHSHKAASQHHDHHIVQNGYPRPKSHNCNRPIGNSALGNPALFMLRDMKKLQTTLRRDDLSWE